MSESGRITTPGWEQTPHMQEFEGALEQWTDERLLSKEDIRAWYLFLVMVVNLGDAAGWSYDGHSLKVGTPMSTLVVRATIDGVAHVVFSSGRTTTACIRAFIRKSEAGWLEWMVDRYR